MTSESSRPVALDAMGGDRAPGAAVEGAIAAYDEGCDVVLVGDEEALRSELEARAITEGTIPIVSAGSVIGMDEEPAKAVRAKRDSSIVRCADLVRSGECVGMVSAGSTGAAMAAAVLRIGRVPGVERPAIATVIPFPGHPLVLIDSGANAECKPAHLGQFAMLGTLFARLALGLDDPRVGLLNIGEEPGKGGQLHKEAYEVLGRLATARVGEGPLYRFVGNIEGHDLPLGRADVCVTDGFTGNVVLKLAEGTARAVIFELMNIFSSGKDERSMSELLEDFREVKRRLNPEGSGGAYLLGVRGICVIAHGAADSNAIAHAIRFAADPEAAAMTEGIEAAVSKFDAYVC